MAVTSRAVLRTMGRDDADAATDAAGADADTDADGTVEFDEDGVPPSEMATKVAGSPAAVTFPNAEGGTTTP